MYRRASSSALNSRRVSKSLTHPPTLPLSCVFSPPTHSCLRTLASVPGNVRSSIDAWFHLSPMSRCVCVCLCVHVVCVYVMLSSAEAVLTLFYLSEMCTHTCIQTRALLVSARACACACARPQGVYQQGRAHELARCHASYRSPCLRGSSPSIAP